MESLFKKSYSFLFQKAKTFITRENQFERLDREAKEEMLKADICLKNLEAARKETEEQKQRITIYEAYQSIYDSNLY